MQINFTGHHIEITPALREFAEGKFEKLLRHFDKIGSINVVFEVNKLRHIAEATVHLAKNEFHGHADSEDLYSAIDLLIDKLDRQLKKHKEKITDHRD
jgi:putative sigma-54 modulation protein